ncbi:uncharacterized protein LOC126842253 [Adelges cooleyi]|uniref:uncharacterized protein LOC126842253 n=1 Tax=Adelges cooleyi TaxID=133065 RepID=UPI00218094E6|nr:uncharacterized protein LOC126842253 [Adelges cooleyi]
MARGYRDRQIGQMVLDVNIPENPILLQSLSPPHQEPARLPIGRGRGRGTGRGRGQQPRRGRPQVTRPQLPPPLPIVETEIEEVIIMNDVGAVLEHQDNDNIEEIEVEVAEPANEDVPNIVMAVRPSFQQPQMPGEKDDRWFVCLGSRGEAGEIINILLPCDHRWCCDTCGRRLEECPICRVIFPRAPRINIMHYRVGENGRWMENLNSLLDPTGSNCISCWRVVRDMPNLTRYAYLYYDYGWRCVDCALPLPEECEVCGDRWRC